MSNHTQNADYDQRRIHTRIPYSRVKRIFAVRRWFDSVIKKKIIKRSFIDMVSSNDSLESERKLLFQLISDKDRTYFK